ncbi:MAG: hypothetical protein JWL82_114 [Parcubacteria group bacterium]|nr:hypothetical protein [Parcubacteria group bacterium]
MTTLSLASTPIAAKCIISHRAMMWNNERAATPLTLDAAKTLGFYSENLDYKVFGINSMIDYAVDLRGLQAAELWEDIHGCIMQLPDSYVPIRERAKRLGPPTDVESAWKVLKVSSDRRRRHQAIHKIIDVATLLEHSDCIWQQLGEFLMKEARVDDLTGPLLGRFAKYTPYKETAAWAKARRVRMLEEASSSAHKSCEEEPEQQKIAA